MTSKNINIIYSKKMSINKNTNIKNLNVNFVEANNENEFSSAINKAKNKYDLIILIPGQLSSYKNIINSIQNNNIPIVYCSIDNADIHDKKNDVVKNLKYVIHGFKLKTTEILLSSSLKIIKYYGEENYN